MKKKHPPSFFFSKKFFDIFLGTTVCVMFFFLKYFIITYTANILHTPPQQHAAIGSLKRYRYSLHEANSAEDTKAGHELPFEIAGVNTDGAWLYCIALTLLLLKHQKIGRFSRDIDWGS